jgi:hypothetical protein
LGPLLLLVVWFHPFWLSVIEALREVVSNNRPNTSDRKRIDHSLSEPLLRVRCQVAALADRENHFGHLSGDVHKSVDSGTVVAAIASPCISQLMLGRNSPAVLRTHRWTRFECPEEHALGYLSTYTHGSLRVSWD